MKKFYLYIVTNSINGKVYIGQTVNHKRRWKDHKWLALNKQEQYLHHAMRKYGIDKFTFEVIVTCNNQENANETEKILIEQYKSRDKQFGYNIAPGGDPAWNRGLPKEQQPMFGKHHSKESKLKSSISNTGKKKPKHTDEWKQRRSEEMMGHVVLDSTKQKISGENHHSAKLNWKLVNLIRKEYKRSNLSQKELSIKYNISHSTINKIVKNKIWIHK